MQKKIVMLSYKEFRKLNGEDDIKTLLANLKGIKFGDITFTKKQILEFLESQRNKLEKETKKYQRLHRNLKTLKIKHEELRVDYEENEALKASNEELKRNYEDLRVNHEKVLKSDRNAEISSSSKRSSYDANIIYEGQHTKAISPSTAYRNPKR